MSSEVTGMSEGEARRAMAEQYEADGHPQARRIAYLPFRNLSYSEQIGIRALMATGGNAPDRDAHVPPTIREAAERLAERMGARMVWDKAE